MKSMVSGPKTPAVSMATGTNECPWSRLEYFRLFRSSAAAATSPAPLAALGRYEVANVSGQVVIIINAKCAGTRPCWFNKTQFSYHCVHPIIANMFSIQILLSNCAKGLHFSAFL